jgi:hypothetical protein
MTVAEARALTYEEVQAFLWVLAKWAKERK